MRGRTITRHIFSRECPTAARYETCCNTDKLWSVVTSYVIRNMGAPDGSTDDSPPEHFFHFLQVCSIVYVVMLLQAQCFIVVMYFFSPISHFVSCWCLLCSVILCLSWCCQAPDACSNDHAELYRQWHEMVERARSCNRCVRVRGQA